MKTLIRSILYIFIVANLFSIIYAQLPQTFIKTAQNTHFGSPEHVAVGKDGQWNS